MKCIMKFRRLLLLSSLDEKELFSVEKVNGIQSAKLKIVWLAPYPFVELADELSLEVSQMTPRKGSWLVHLSRELVKQFDVELYIIMCTKHVTHAHYFRKFGINFIVLHHGLPLIKKGIPNWLPFDWLSKFPITRNRIEVIVKKIDPDLIHIHGTENIYAHIGLAFKSPKILSIQGLITEVYKFEPSFRNKLIGSIEQKVIKSYSVFGCRTDWDKEFVLALNQNAIIHYMPEAINEVFFNTNYVPPNTPRFVYTGGLLKRKGFHDLISALGIVKLKMKKFELVVIGSTPPSIKQKELNDLIVSNNLVDNVKFLGAINQHSIAEELAHSTIYIHPSHVDNSPNSLIEAMAVGVPCIASRVGGIPTLIKNQVSGLLFEPTNVQELSKQILLLVENPTFRHDIGKAGKTAVDGFRPINAATTTLEVYKAILRNS